MRIIALLLLALAAVMLTPANASAAIFGTRCQSDFQNGWSVTLPEVWDRCAWFNDELDDTDQKAFYFNLQGAHVKFTGCDECSAGPDSVHLFYVDSHGGANPGNAGIFMWDQRSIAITPRDGMRYGDENVGLAILAQYLCKTLSVDSHANIVARWVPVFSGGMIMATGSHDLVWDGVTTDEVGEDFADDLQSRKTVANSWFDANSDWDADQDLAVFATGSSLTGAHNAEADCAFRRDRLTWQNFGQFARWRDNQVEWICFSKIDDA